MATQRIVQLTDTHLYGAPGHSWGRYRPAASLDAVLAAMAARERHVDALLLTGDIAMDGEAEAYRAIVDRCAGRGMPVLAVPGNHDDPSCMADIFGAAGIICESVTPVGAWDLVPLSSHVPGEQGGALSAAALAGLEQHLAASAGRWQLIVVHHPPVAVGSAWMDAMGLDNADELFAILRRHRHVRAIVSGHVHQVHEAQLGDITVYTTPSTCMQFLPAAAAFAEDTAAAPGYRWLELADSGGLATGVVRVPAALPSGVSTE